MIIKLYDDEAEDYPLIEIKDDYYEDFRFLLEAYQQEEQYNFDDFIDKIKENDWFIRSFSPDKEVYF